MLDEDVADLEDVLYGDDEDDCDCGCKGGFDYQTECPNCGEEVLLDDEILEDGVFECPHCHETIDFSGEGLECEPGADGCGCGCGHDHDEH